MYKFTLLLVCLSHMACKSKPTTTGNYQDIEVVALAKEMKKYQDPIVMDVRTPKEVAEGNVKGSLHIDYKADNFVSELEKLDKDKAYFVYCRSGGRSSKAMKKMKELGFNRVYNILGGYNAIQNPEKQ